MRPTPKMRELRRARLAAGALVIGFPASAAAVTAGAAIARTPGSDTAPVDAIRAILTTPRIQYGANVTVEGTAPEADDGHTVALQFEAAPGSSWQSLSSTMVAGGRFRLAAPLGRSGRVRALDTTTSPQAPAALSAGPRAVAASAGSQPVSVAAAVNAPKRSIDAFGPRAFQVRGRLLPALPGRLVRLQGGAGGWHTLAVARTGVGGAFDLRYTATATEQLRVQFPGDAVNASSSARVGQLTVYRQSQASWYDDGGATACGFHAQYGVANRDLPCGTKVKFSYGGRSVTAEVDDRGPYVGGRDWDLDQSTAAALGFSGVGTVWSSL